MKISINVKTELEGNDLDNLRDVLATIVEEAVSLVPGETAVGTTLEPDTKPRRRVAISRRY